MKHKTLLYLISLFIIFSISAIAQPGDVPSQNEPGKCYAKSITPAGTAEWFEVLCNNQVSPAIYQEIQNALREHGFYKGESSADFNKETKDALTNFQTANGLPVGQLDIQSLDALGLSIAKKRMAEIRLKDEEKALKEAKKKLAVEKKALKKQRKKQKKGGDLKIEN